MPKDADTQELAEMAARMGANFIESQAKEFLSRVNAEKAKYEAIVPRLTDEAFAALFSVVMEEREKRVMRLIIENPLVRQQAISDLARKMQDEERAGNN
jgi:hypothetical protein